MLLLTTALLFLSHGGRVEVLPRIIFNHGVTFFVAWGRVEVAPFGERMPLHQWKMSGIAHVVNGTIMMNGEFVDTNASPPGHLGAGRFCPMHGSCIFFVERYLRDNSVQIKFVPDVAEWFLAGRDNLFEEPILCERQKRHDFSRVQKSSTIHCLIRTVAMNYM